MTVAGDENRERDQHQRGNQAASPPSILSKNVLLDTLKAPFEAFFSGLRLISWDTRFFRH
jgi:hypothetical protein